MQQRAKAIGYPPFFLLFLTFCQGFPVAAFLKNPEVKGAEECSSCIVEQSGGQVV